MRAIKKWVERNIKPSNNKGPAPKGSGKSKSNSHKRSKKQTVDCAGKPPDHGERVSNKQTLDTYGRKARARPIPYQPIPS